MISGAILAAGSSRRMGRAKLFAQLRGKPVLSYVLDSFLASRLDEVLLIVGEAAVDSVSRSPHGRARIVVNHDPSEGMASSLRLALQSASGQAIVIGMGDQPLLLPSTLDAMISAYSGSNAKVVIPTFDGRRGNPVLFDRALFPQIMKIHGDVGAKSVVSDNSGLVREVMVSDEGVLLDVDTESDLELVRMVLERRSRRTKSRAAEWRPAYRQPPAR